MTETSTAPPERQPESQGSQSHGMSTMAIGIVLVLVGAALFAGQLLGIGIEDIGWPFFVIAAGVAILLIGLLVAPDQGMAIGGAITTTVGFVLLYQDRTDQWESWAYAWALVGPAASGLGLALWGIRSRDAADLRNGTWGLLGGLAMFAIGFLFFEGVIGIGGERLALPSWLLPVAVIVIGVAVLGRGFLERRET
ncbi:MAG: hypothetical protein ACR2GO_04025 [Candidatus Limnocylindria bacterium]